MSALGMGGAGLPQSIQLPGAGPAAGGAPDASGPGDEQDLMDGIKALQKFMTEEEDHVIAAQVAKCVADLRGVLATLQKGAESALGVTPAHKAMSRSYGG